MMNTLRSIVFLLFLVEVCSGVCAWSATDAPQGAADQVSLSSFLNKAGGKLSCYFTIEDVDDDRPLDERQLPSTMPESKAQLLAFLKTQLSDAYVFVDPSRREVVHIVRRALKNRSQYPLDAPVSITYTGLLYWLPDAIGTVINGRVVSERAILSTRTRIDTVTNISVKDIKQPVRKILTCTTPLNGYSRILWRSTVGRNRTNGDEVVFVQFFGPSQDLPVVPSTEKPIREVHINAGGSTK
ncbi:MAG: hypothetical protein P4L33_00520 [Capsulimonadaceae bacterium]|nr:hypothetical protein [Capsulimonadaceae bacterium]